jgi:hypothetical protein
MKQKYHKRGRDAMRRLPTGFDPAVVILPLHGHEPNQPELSLSEHVKVLNHRGEESTRVSS